MTKRLLIRNLRLPLDSKEEEFSGLFERQLSLPAGTILSLRLVRQSIDARKKNAVCFSVHIEAEMEEKAALRLIGAGLAEEALREEGTELVHGNERQRGRIVVAGLGPCGLFAARLLAAEGYRPLVIERGKPVSERVSDVERYWRSGELNPHSNVAFGEGGAGTFSDGKLTTRIKDRRIDRVLRGLIDCGAPKEIAYLARPHIGTDRLRSVVFNLRRQIEELGGEVRFSSRLCDVQISDGKLTHIVIEAGGEKERIECCALLLAIGQGARDTYEMLYDRGLWMQAKPFAAGVRVEHPQILINRAQYGEFFDRPRLGAASYALTGKSGDRGVYTFCMCPGGRVIASASGEEQVVTNGMSDYARDGKNANAAIVVQVRPEDCGASPLDGLRFLNRLERSAYQLGGGGGTAPASTVEAYLAGRRCKRFLEVSPTYLPGVRGEHLETCLPDFINAGIREGIRQFSRQLRGFDMPEAVLTAVESRTSAPLRIVRGEDMESPSAHGIYPLGEGAGYAGGIVSAAVDGLKGAEAVIARFSEKP
ncbi:MAG: hypothetical protein Q4C04_06705 [Clostridia bacterium]|nr:hypothetical protein [Clostridia bacterium]